MDMEGKNTESFLGYKYTCLGEFPIRGRRRIFIVVLQCFNKFGYYGFSTYTTDCIVKEIYNLNTGEEVQEISGKAFQKYTYTVGKHIIGEKIFFCDSIEELERWGYITKDEYGYRETTFRESFAKAKGRWQQQLK